MQKEHNVFVIGVIVTKTRNSSLDLYRILCMFLITTIHVIEYKDLAPNNSINAFFVDLLEVLQYFSISGFTLLSGYFLVNKDSTTTKVVSFILQLSFYSIIIFLISILIEPRFSASLIVKSIFPTIFAHYWYPINYLFLLLLVPYFNKFIDCLSQRKHLSFICVLSLITSVYFHCSPFTGPAPYIGHYSHSMLWFILLYFIAAYIKIYGIKRKMLFGPVMFLVCGTLIFVLRTMADHRIFGMVDLLSYNSILSLLFTVSSFVSFTNFKLNLGKCFGAALTYCMPAVFAIYLIQEHDAVRTNLWNFVNITDWSESVWLIPIVLLVFVLLFAAALILNLLYQMAYKLFISKVEIAILKLYNRVCAKIK